LRGAASGKIDQRFAACRRKVQAACSIRDDPALRQELLYRYAELSPAIHQVAQRGLNDARRPSASRAWSGRHNSTGGGTADEESRTEAQEGVS
jgi:hypothetical protein